VKPLFTIAIPTYNRAAYLGANLQQLRSELRKIDSAEVQILVSDNASTDDTAAVVDSFRREGMAIRYLRNSENLGWGRNFAQCFREAAGKYVLLLGDDDLLYDDALPLIMERLRDHDYGVVCLRAYGYDDDFRAEYPGNFGREMYFTDPSEFIFRIGTWMTFISSCVMNKELLGDTPPEEFTRGDLAALPLVLRCALAAPENLYIERYLVAGKRANSFNYEFSEVFATEMWGTIDAHEALGLRAEVIDRLARRMLFAYYPYYLLDVVAHRRSDPSLAWQNFNARFHDYRLFRAWAGPILWLPRPLAIGWGWFTTFVGRAADGEFRRGIAFFKRKLTRAFVR
jgi:abequosyltransferase